MQNKLLYHHRTQGEGVEGVHIRGMIDGFRSFGYVADIVGPPGVDPYVFKEFDGKKAEEPSFLKRLWARVSSSVPQSIFEFFELIYNLYAYVTLRFHFKNGCYRFFYERYALNTFAGVLLARQYETFCILEVNDATVIERSRPLAFRKVAEFIEGKVFNRSDLIVTISGRFKKLISDRYAIDPEKILVLPNAIEPDRFSCHDLDRLSKMDLGIPSDRLVLGCVGAFVPWHGLEFMVESLAPMVKERNFQFLMVGSGPVRESVENLAKQLGIGDRICFTGFIPSSEVPHYLNLLDIAVIPGSNEHCSPMKLFEYMALGKPVVLPRYEPLLDTISDGVEGIFFEPGSGTSFCKGVEVLADDKNLREVMGARGLEKVLGQYTWCRNAERTLQKVNNSD